MTRKVPQRVDRVAEQWAQNPCCFVRVRMKQVQREQLTPEWAYPLELTDLLVQTPNALGACVVFCKTRDPKAGTAEEQRALGLLKERVRAAYQILKKPCPELNSPQESLF